VDRRGQDPYWRNILKGLIKYKKGERKKRRNRKHA
jgi:hypothetical protein